jgi:hypothetical protein
MARSVDRLAEAAVRKEQLELPPDRVADPIMWSAAAAWRDSVAGLARIAEEAHSWGFTLDREDEDESTTPAH